MGSTRMKRWLMGLFCILMAWAASAEGPAAVRKRAEASMLVTGSVEITPDGSVKNYSIDQPDKLPLPVVQIIRQNMPLWRFQFGSPQATAVTVKMSLRILAKRIDDTHESLSISAAQFGQDDKVPGESPSFKTRLPPRYPELEARSKVSGTVYLLLRIGRDGRVEDAAAEQVNLNVYASDRDMKLFRDGLAKAALSAARQWTFNTPTTGKHVADDYWVAWAPVSFELLPFGDHKDKVVPYGQWQVYVPGPRQLVPWVEKKKLLTGAADAAPDGSLYQLDRDLWLTTPLGGA